MKRLIWSVFVFVLGFAACALILQNRYGSVATGGGSLAVAPSKPRGTPIVQPNGRNPVADAAARIEKAVVNIDTVGRPVETGFPGILFGQPQEVVPQGQASGVIIRPDGYVLTNNHVVADTSKVFVTLWNKKRYQADIVGRDSKTDLAVIRIPARNLPYAAFGNSSTLKVGDWVIAVGNPLGLGTTVTVGVVSATERGPLRIEGEVLEDAVQTDAAINRGNSGGALADINGDLVGINAAIASTNPGGGSIGIGFAIPSNRARWVAEQIISRGKVIRPWLGIMYTGLNDELRQALKAQGETAIPAVNGALIREVVRGSPADRAGLMPLDVITEIGGKKVDDVKVVADAVSAAKVGQIMDLTVWHARTGKSGKVAVTTGEMPANL